MESVGRTLLADAERLRRRVSVAVPSCPKLATYECRNRISLNERFRVNGRVFRRRQSVGLCGLCRFRRVNLNVGKRPPRFTWRAASRRLKIPCWMTATAAAYPFERDIENVQYRVDRVPATSADSVEKLANYFE